MGTWGFIHYQPCTMRDIKTSQAQSDAHLDGTGILYCMCGTGACVVYAWQLV